MDKEIFFTMVERQTMNTYDIGAMQSIDNFGFVSDQTGDVMALSKITSDIVREKKDARIILRPLYVGSQGTFIFH